MAKIEADHAGAPVDRLARRYLPSEFASADTTAAVTARYLWIAELAADCAVLDVGCGLSAGTAALVHAGARRLTIVDDRQTRVELAEAEGHAGVEHIVAPLTEIPFEDASFDLVSCLQAFARPLDAEMLLGELLRVLRPEGVLVLWLPSAISPALRVPLDHVVEYPIEARLAWTLGDRTGAALQVASNAGQRGTSGALVVASRAPAPDLVGALMLGPRLGELDWAHRFEHQAAELAARSAALASLQSQSGERLQALRALARKEAELAAVPDLRERLEQARRDNDVLIAERDALLRDKESQAQGIGKLRAELQRADSTLRSMRESPSWRVTAPLRRAKSVLGWERQPGWTTEP